jgi:hypothetical protein
MRQGFKVLRVQAGLELLILMPEPPEYWDYRWEPPLLIPILAVLVLLMTVSYFLSGYLRKEVIHKFFGLGVFPSVT